MGLAKPPVDKQREYGRRYRALHAEEISEKKRAYYIAHPEKRKRYKDLTSAQKRHKVEYQRRWMKANPYAWQIHYLSKMKSLYGLTPERLFILAAVQRGRCAICGGDYFDKRGHFHVDHDHQRGRVRGLLCGNCNRMLGCARDNPGFLRAAAMYLEERKKD